MINRFLAKTRIDAVAIMKPTQQQVYIKIINQLSSSFSPLLTPPRGGLKAPETPETPHCGQRTYTHLFTSLCFSFTQSFTHCFLQVFCFYSPSLLSHPNFTFSYSIHFSLTISHSPSISASIHLSPP